MVSKLAPIYAPIEMTAQEISMNIFSAPIIGLVVSQGRAMILVAENGRLGRTA
jgi:hypothetical protein